MTYGSFSALQGLVVQVLLRRQFIRQSSKSTSKTEATNAESQRRRELEQGFNNVQNKRENRVRQLRDVADEYLADYRLRFRGVTFAEYAIGHVVRLLGDALLVDIDESPVFKYQTDRLKESAAPKSINEKVRFLLRMMGESGDVIRVRLRKRKKLKLPSRRKIGKAYELEETQEMRQLSRNSRSPHIHLALTMALNAGMRDAEIKSLAWSQIHLDKNFIEVERARRLPERDGRFQSTPFSRRPSRSTWHGIGRNSMRFARSGLSFLLVGHAPGIPRGM